MNNQDSTPTPRGKLTLSAFALPKDTNGHGNIYAGWIASQMDLAAAATAEKITASRVVTVAIDAMNFVSPVEVGSHLNFYTDVLEIGSSSIRILVDVWAHEYNNNNPHKVTEASFVIVSVDNNGHTKRIEPR